MKKFLFLVFASIVLGACSLPGSGGTASTNHSCSDKVMQEITTNKAVSGTWACLTHDFQVAVAGDGLPSNDNVFVLDQSSFPSITFKYAGRQYDVDLYAAQVTFPNEQPYTLSTAIWVDKNNLVVNFGIGHRLF